MNWALIAPLLFFLPELLLSAGLAAFPALLQAAHLPDSGSLASQAHCEAPQIIEEESPKAFLLADCFSAATPLPATK
jgi:hypothetical protein